MTERAQALGFSPQKETIYNTFLPYSDKLDEESKFLWDEIKTNFCKAVLCQDFRDICYWCHQLGRYLRHYRLKISKADHVQLIKVCYELLLMPGLELNFLKRIVLLLDVLIRKSNLLSRDDLTLPWRPLYDLYHSIFYSSADSYGMVVTPKNLENNLKVLIKDCNVYFSVESTQEILDELRPLMCPFDTEMAVAIDYCEMFLCTSLPPSEHDKGFKLWFDELMNMWLQWHNVPSWENTFLFLLSRLAKDNIGYVNWEPHIPMLFTRLLRSFNLPGRKSMIQIVRGTPTFDTNAIATLIISMLGNGSSCQLHINRLFKALESFYHPSNHGRWLPRMLRILHKLPSALTLRLHRERHDKPSWKTPIPDKSKLTDQEVTDFVNSLKSAVILSMFSKRGCADSSRALLNLGALRPELVIPPLLEGLYSSLETLTEPHRLTAAMDCIVPVCRPLVRSNKYFPDGPRHVIPLLMAALPGIDPNDIKKCWTTFQFISSLGSLVLFIDCSSAVNTTSDLPEVVQEVCLSTAAFEDFVLQFMDRLFALIENSCLDNTSRLDRDSERTNPEENLLQGGLYSTFGMVMMQSSPAIYKVALSKLQSFVTSHIFEINVSGKYAASMCHCMTRVNSELGLKAFVPHFSKLVLALTNSEEIFNEEKLDDELLFSLLILTEVTGCDGKYLLEYQDYLIQVLERAFRLKCKEGYLLGCTLLKQMLKMYTSIFPLENFSVPDPWNRHSDEDLHLYIEDWGKPGDLHNLQTKYHHLSEEEIEAAKLLLEKFLIPELEKLGSVSMLKNMTRESLHRSLSIVLNCIWGAASCLPMWDEEPIPLDTTLGLQLSYQFECGTKNIDLNGKNVRQTVTETIRKLNEYFTECCEDDTKGLFLIIKIYNALIFNWGIEKDKLDARLKTYGMIKSVLSNKLYGRKNHIRYLLVDRIYMQHEVRVSEKSELYFTNTHQLLINDLLSLSTSHYSEVRKSAQAVLNNCFVVFFDAYKAVVPRIIELLGKDPTLYHEEFKGILHVILGQRPRNFLTACDWDLIGQLFPAIVASRHSEKPSIIKLLDSISNYLQKHMPAIQINVKIPESCIEAVKSFWSKSDPQPSAQCFSDEKIRQFAESQVECSKSREKQYYNLLHSLMDLMQNGSLHWRHYQLSLVMLVILGRPDVHAPKELVRLFVSHINHDTLAIRKFSIQGLTWVLKQQKRKHPKIKIVPQEQNPSKLTLHPSMPKVEENWAPDNFWMLYNSANLPDTYEKWNSRHFVHKTHWGFLTWPKEFEVYAPESDQPNLDRSFEDLTEVEKPIYEAFMQQSFVDKLISFLSLEEKKDQDKFDVKVFYLFRTLFSNFGDTFLPLFIDHLDKMVVDKQESVQRCASEILCGIVNGSKHWNFEKMEKLKSLAIPLLEKVVNNITPETINDWSTALATLSQNRDPNKYYWLFEFFMKEPASIENGSFLESSWLFLLMSLIIQQEWRVFELHHRALNLILPKLDHSYQNVREKLGCFLGYIFLFDVPINAKILELAPSRRIFLNSVIPKLEVLLTSPEVDGTISDSVLEESPQRKSAKNLFRTIMRWIAVNGSKSLYTVPPEVMNLLPLLWHMMNDTTDESFQRECRVAQAILGQAFLTQESISAAINILQNVTSGNSWHSRVCACAYLQTMVFTNLYSVMSNERWTKDIYDIVLRLLLDEHVEVRESAAETLCGFLHCEYFKISEELLTLFKTKSRKKLTRKESASNNGPRIYDPEDIRERHAGILGLCACVNAYPYDVPEFLPDILVLLGDHLNDPLPISATIKKSLSGFRRTHHDNWRDHKLKFTDDQLAVITDLLVSPSYYA